MINLYRTICGWRNGNAGDICSEEIIERLFNLAVNAKEDDEALKNNEIDLVAGGSIAEKIPYKYDGFIYTSGLMFEHSRADTPEATVCAVRGYLTQNRWLGHQAEYAAIGDIGLLVSELFNGALMPKNTRYKVGIIPHYIDSDNIGIRNFLEKNKDCVGIDICGRLDDVLSLMGQCEIILSSSLHGLIFADSLGIPNTWIHLSDKISGGSFKFRDYYSVFGITDPKAILFNEAMSIKDFEDFTSGYYRPKIAAIKQNLIEAFPAKGLLAREQNRLDEHHSALSEAIIKLETEIK